MKTGRKAALTACSDPLPGSGREIVEEVAQYLAEKGLIVERSPYLFGCDESDPGRNSPGRNSRADRNTRSFPGGEAAVF